MPKNPNIFLEKQRKYYKSIVSVFCPILQETIYFTSKGFNHLIYRTYGRPRKWSEAFMKLKCLKHAPDVLSKCTIVKKTRTHKIIVKGITKQMTSHELVYEVRKGKKIRVVVGKIGTGKLRFISTMPHNKKSKPGTKKGAKRSVRKVTKRTKKRPLRRS